MPETRGADLTDAQMEEGTEEENDIQEATFLFFNKGSYAFSKTVKKTNTDNPKLVWVDNGSHTSSDKCAVVKLDKDCDAVTVICNYTPKMNANSLVNEAVNYKNTTLNKHIMSNAVYIDGENVSTAKRAWRATIDPSKVYATYEEAAAGSDVAATINVERLSAKVRVYSTKYNNNAFDPMDQEDAGQPKKDLLNDEVTVEFTPENVSLTAIQSGSYLLKMITPSDYVNADPAFFNAINDASNQRCFWCKSVDATPTYITYSKAAGDVFNASKDAAKAKPFYVHENTDEEDVKTTNVVVMGKYVIKDKDGNVLGVKEGSTDATNGEEVGTFWLTAFGGKYTVHSTKASVLKAMGLDNDADYELKEDLDDNGNWTGWMKIDGTAVRCLKYSAGAGYYAAPIKRFTINGIDYNGIVRNHIYDLSIDKISGMGIGLPSLDHPIIPVTPPDPNDQTYYMHMSVNVLNWAIVPTQSVKW